MYEMLAYECVRACVRACERACMYVFLYVWMYACMCTCVLYIMVARTHECTHTPHTQAHAFDHCQIVNLVLLIKLVLFINPCLVPSTQMVVTFHC